MAREQLTETYLRELVPSTYWGHPGLVQDGTDARGIPSAESRGILFKWVAKEHSFVPSEKGEGEKCFLFLPQKSGPLTHGRFGWNDVIEMVNSRAVIVCDASTNEQVSIEDIRKRVKPTIYAPTEYRREKLR